MPARRSHLIFSLMHLPSEGHNRTHPVSVKQKKYFSSNGIEWVLFFKKTFFLQANVLFTHCHPNVFSSSPLLVQVHLFSTQEQVEVIPSTISSSLVLMLVFLTLISQPTILCTCKSSLEPSLLSSSTVSSYFIHSANESQIIIFDITTVL